MRLVRNRADKLHDRLADGGLEHTVALIGKLGLSLCQCLAGRSAVDGQQVRNAGLVLAVVADGGLAVGHGALELAHDVLRLVHQIDAAVGIGLRHLVFRIAETHDACAHLRDERLRQREGVGENVVEARGDVAAKLYMLFLILAHGHKIGLIQQDIRRHQNGVGEQTGRDVVGMLLRLLLKLRHAAELAELRIAAEHPAQLRVLRHMALDEHDILLRIETAGDILRELFECAPPQIGGHLTHGDGVHIDNAEQTLIFVLQCSPVLDGAHVRAERQIAAGLNA